MNETVADRILATPRTDVIDGKRLAPKTEGAAADIEAQMSSWHAANVARGVASVGLNSDVISKASANASADVALLPWPFIANSRYGKILTVWASLRDADPENSGKISIAVAQKMLALIEPEKLEDFLQWYWRKGKYLIPKYPPEGPANQSGTEKSSQASSSDTRIGPTQQSAD